MRFMGLAGMLLCFTGAIAAMFVVLVRLPALANTKLEMLFGVLQGTGVSLLFAVAGLLINLTMMLRRVTHHPGLPVDSTFGLELRIDGAQ
jgi:hypothetical protein